MRERVTVVIYLFVCLFVCLFVQADLEDRKILALPRGMNLKWTTI